MCNDKNVRNHQTMYYDIECRAQYITPLQDRLFLLIVKCFLSVLSSQL